MDSVERFDLQTISDLCSRGRVPIGDTGGRMIGLHETSSARADLSRVPYLPGLDGLRAVAVVGVMLYHANHGWLSGGLLGVEVFFVISGYLITLLIVGEFERTGQLGLRQFWFRRFRRLLPALFVMMAALAIYMSLFHRRPQGQSRGDFLAGIFYVSNWYQIFVGQGYTAAEAFAPLRHLWSLAVEEQFYIIWPLVMILILRKGTAHLPRVGLWLLGVSVSIAIVTGVLFAGGDVASVCSVEQPNGDWHLFGRCISINETLYLSTLTRAGGLMLGAAFAMVWRPAAILRGKLRDKGRQLDVLAGAGLAMLVFLMWALSLTEPGEAFGIQFDPWLFRGGFFVTGLATVLIIAAATHQRAATGSLLGNPLFVWIGTRSYGLYLYHWPIYQIIRESAGRPLSIAQFVLAMMITVPITEASYRYVETPIRKGRLGELVRGLPRAGAAERTRRKNLLIVLGSLGFLAATAAVSFAAADNLCVGDVACSLATTATNPTRTSAPTAGTPDTSGAPITSPGGTVAGETTLPTTTTVNLDLLAPTALGESVMKGAEAPLLAGGFVVDAQENRTGEEMADLVETMRANDDLGRIVVVQIGTNGTVEQADLDRVMVALPADLTPTVVFLTVTAPQNWIAGNNERIRALPATYPNVTIADWEAASATVELCDDRIHIACNGSAPARTYTDMIFDAAGRPDLKPVATPPTA